MIISKTRAVKATLGVFNEEPKCNSVPDLRTFNRTLTQIQDEFYKESGVYVAYQTSIVYCNYHKDWGGFDGGEPCILLTAIANPKFVEDFVVWENVAKSIAIKLKELYNQNTITIESYDAEITYVTD